MATSKKPTKTFAMFEFQDKLPMLPVPDLKASLKNFLVSVQPLLTADEKVEAERLVADMANDTTVADLQRQLQERAAHSAALVAQSRSGQTPKVDHEGMMPHPDGSVFPHAHWLELWWEKYAYLSGRDSLCCYLNVFNPLYGSAPLPDSPDLGARCAQRAAWTVLGMLDFYARMRTGQFGDLPPEMGGKTPFCSAQYEKVFATVRVAREGMDDVATYVESRHICVMRKGHWYRLDPFGLSAVQLCDMLEWIKADADARPFIPTDQKISVLTGWDRDLWAKARLELQDNKDSCESLKDIETAVLHLILSDKRPGNPEEVQNLAQHMDGEGVWFDKTLSLIQFDNGCFGANLEHTAADAVVPARVLMYAGEFTTQNAAPGIGYPTQLYQGLAGVSITKLGPNETLQTPALFSQQRSLSVRHLSIPLSTGLKQKIQQALVYVKAILNDNNLTVLTFDEFGSRDIIKNAKMGPDSFMQMCLALAFARDQKHRTGKLVPATYETAMTRGFFHGRTETIRSQSNESLAMVSAFDDPSVPSSTKADLVRAAATYHRNYLMRCMAGQGSDRHLMGLKLLAMETGKPLHPLYTHKAYTTSTDFELSTSQLPWGARDYPGFGAPGPNAYGVCYRFSVDGTIRATVASRRSCVTKDAPRFRDEIAKALVDVLEVMKQNNAQDNKRAKL